MHAYCALQVRARNGCACHGCTLGYAKNASAVGPFKRSSSLILALDALFRHGSILRLEVQENALSRIVPLQRETVSKLTHING